MLKLSIPTKKESIQSWLRRYRQHHVKSQTKSDWLKENGFLPLEPEFSVETTVSRENNFTIEYPSGVRFLLGVDTDIKFIHELLMLQV